MKIIFMGTHQYAVKMLEKILTEHDVVLVVTQPDSLVGRKKILTPSAVKTAALKHNLKIFQPVKLNKEKEEIFKYPADLIVTAAYGQIIATKILEFPKYGSINVHGSLLPYYRGGAPIQRAIMNGEDKTGISIMYMAQGMDTGDVIVQREIPITMTDTQATIFDALSTLGSEMILDVISDIEKGIAKRYPQDVSKVTFAYNLTKEDEIIDFHKSALTIYNQIRALNPNPGASFTIDDVVYKVYESTISDKEYQGDVGIIKNVTKNSFDVTCGDNSLITFTNILPQGKRLMSVRDYLNGSGKNVIYENRRIYG